MNKRNLSTANQDYNDMGQDFTFNDSSNVKTEETQGQKQVQFDLSKDKLHQDKTLFRLTRGGMGLLCEVQTDP